MRRLKLLNILNVDLCRLTKNKIWMSDVPKLHYSGKDRRLIVEFWGLG